jgi:hypothetical protein
MKTFHAVLLTALLTSIITAQAQDTAPLRLLQAIPLPNVKGRIDHLAVDLIGRRLFVAALGNDTMESIGLQAGKRIHTISGLHEPQGVLFIPEFRKIFVTNGQTGAVQIFNGDSFSLDNRVKFADDADNIRYDPATKYIYVGYGKGALGIIDAASGQRLGDIKLAGHPESFQLEKSGPRIFVNVPTAHHIAVVDRDKRLVVATWRLMGTRANFPMALDETRHRLFVGFRKPAKLAVFDTESGRSVAMLDSAGDCDDVFYDAERRRVYMSCGEGSIDVFEQRDADHYKAIVKIPTASGARTSLFVPELNRLYLAVPQRANQGAEIRVYEVQP